MQFSEREVWEILKQMTSVLNCLQDFNIQHRDIKPQNIVKVGKIYKLIDLDAGKSFENQKFQSTKNINP